MKLVRSFIVAFSMYSKIPMPQCEWTDDSMSYAMCFWPWVGTVIGLLTYGWGKIGTLAEINSIFFTAVLLLISVMITGGIHLDGLLDTADALSSWQTRERRLEILKDSHAGAFAIITCVMYFIMLFGVYAQADLAVLAVMVPGFMLSRTLSALAIVFFPKAKKDGTAAAFSKGAETKRVGLIMIIYLLILAAGMIALHPLLGITALIAAALVFGYYHHMAMKNFGGITGDLAGWFLSICELMMPLSMVVVQIVIRSTV